MTVGERIREERKIKGLSQKELAKLTGIAEITIRGYENNKFKPKTEQLKKISDTFNVGMNYLLGYTPYKSEVDRINSYRSGDELSKNLNLLKVADRRTLIFSLNMGINLLGNNSIIQGDEKNDLDLISKISRVFGSLCGMANVAAGVIERIGNNDDVAQNLILLTQAQNRALKNIEELSYILTNLIQENLEADEQKEFCKNARDEFLKNTRGGEKNAPKD